MPLPTGNSSYYQPIAFAQPVNNATYPTIPTTQPNNAMCTPRASDKMTMKEILFGFSPISPATSSALGVSGSPSGNYIAEGTGGNPSIFGAYANQNGASFINPATPMMPYNNNSLNPLYQNQALANSLPGTAGINPFFTNPSGLGTPLPAATSTSSSSSGANSSNILTSLLGLGSTFLLGGKNSTNPSSEIDKNGSLGKTNADGTVTLDPATVEATYTDADGNTQKITASEATTVPAPEATILATWTDPYDGTTGSTTASTSDVRPLDLTLGTLSYEGSNNDFITYENGGQSTEVVASSTIEYSPSDLGRNYDI